MSTPILFSFCWKSCLFDFARNHFDDIIEHGQDVILRLQDVRQDLNLFI